MKKKKEDNIATAEAAIEQTYPQETVENAGKKKNRKPQKAAKPEVKAQETAPQTEQEESKAEEAKIEVPEKEKDLPETSERQPRQKRARIQKTQQNAEPVRESEATAATVEQPAKEHKPAPQQNNNHQQTESIITARNSISRKTAMTRQIIRLSITTISRASRSRSRSRRSSVLQNLL